MNWFSNPEIEKYWPLDHGRLLPDDYWTDLAGRPFRGGQDGKLGVLAMSCPRGGKSSILEHLIRAAVVNKKRCLCIDFDGSLDHRLREVAPTSEGYKVVRVDPFTKPGRRVRWRSLWRSPLEISRFARQVAPIPEGSHNPFFDAFTQLGMIAAISLLMRFAPNTCTLGDLIRLCDDPYLLATLGDKVPSIGNPFKAIGLRGRSSRDVQATIKTKTYDLRILAAVSDACQEEWDPAEVLEGEPSAAVLVFKDEFKHAVAPLYSALLDTLIYKKLSMEQPDQLHVLADELPSLRPLDSLIDLVRRGSKRTLCYYVSAHSPEGIINVYGRENGEDILNLPAFKVFLKQGSKSSAQWAADILGVREVLERIAPEVYTHGKGPSLTMVQQTVKEKPNVRWSVLQHLRLADWRDNSLCGFATGVDPEGESYIRQFLDLPFQAMVSTQYPPPVRENMPASAQTLQPWKGEEELATRLNIDRAIYREARQWEARDRNRGGGDQEQAQ